MSRNRFVKAGGRRWGGPPVARAGIIAVLSFATAILLGTLLLMLPGATLAGVGSPFDVALFTSVSAISSTGLSVVEVGTYWSRFGQLIILLLLEVGGIGFGATATLLFWIVGRNISLQDRRVLSEIVPGTTLAQAARTAVVIVAISLAIQVVGAAVMFAGWVGRYPPADAAFLAAFHSAGAFCNAGFDIFGTVAQPSPGLIADRHNALVVLPIAGLILLGGVGFPVLFELASWRPRRLMNALPWARRGTRVPRPPLSLHARLVLVAHFGLFVLATVGIWLLEAGNPGTLGNEPPNLQMIDAITTAAYPRTAGFVAVPPLALTPSSLLVLMLLMFIGTGSAGTGGGVKVNTVAALFASVAATLAGRQRPELFKRTLTQESINKALAVVMIAAGVIMAATFALTLTEPHLPVERLLFEVVSAFGTAGLSLDVTPRLSDAGRVIIALMMFVGRLGPLTLVLILTAREQTPAVTYVEEPILVG